MADATERLTNLFANRFGEEYRSQISAATTMDDIPEWDSLSFLDLVMEIEDEFSVKISPNEVAQMFQFGNIVRIVEAKL